jgi:hypothetical protein
MAKEKLTPIMLRLPDDLRRKLVDEAAKARRSLNAEMVHRLERDLKGDRLEKLIARGPDHLATMRGALAEGREFSESLKAQAAEARSMIEEMRAASVKVDALIRELEGLERKNET